MSVGPQLRALCLHTGGSYWLDVVATPGPRGAGPLVRWLRGGPQLPLGDGVEPALELLGAAHAADRGPASALWARLSPDGPAPGGTSADLVLVAAGWARAHADRLEGVLPDPGAALATDRPVVVLSGSGALRLRSDGSVLISPVEGWADKLRHLSRSLAGLSVARVLLLAPEGQAPEVQALLAALGWPWSVEVIAVPDLSGLRERLARALLRAEGWAALGPPGIAPLVAAAGELAQEQALGFLGVTHLALALAQVPGGGQARTHLRRLRHFFQNNPVWQVSEAGLPMALTPRVVSLLTSLPSGADPEALALALVQDRTSPLHVRAGGDLGALVAECSGTYTRGAWAAELVPLATALQVVDGPEDGRVLRLRPGDTLGRAGGEATVALYGCTGCVDLALSREHLRWEGEGRATALKAVRQERDGGRLPTSAALELRVGDLLRLTPQTTLVALGEGVDWP